jgi:hypothetical protein
MNKRIIPKDVIPNVRVDSFNTQFQELKMKFAESFKLIEPKQSDMLLSDFSLLDVRTQVGPPPIGDVIYEFPQFVLGLISEDDDAVCDFVECFTESLVIDSSFLVIRRWWEAAMVSNFLDPPKLVIYARIGVPKEHQEKVINDLTEMWAQRRTIMATKKKVTPKKDKTEAKFPDFIKKAMDKKSDPKENTKADKMEDMKKKMQHSAKKSCKK